MVLCLVPIVRLLLGVILFKDSNYRANGGSPGGNGASDVWGNGCNGGSGGGLDDPGGSDGSDGEAGRRKDYDASGTDLRECVYQFLDKWK